MSFETALGPPAAALDHLVGTGRARAFLRDQDGGSQAPSLHNGELIWTPATRRQHSREGLRYETDLTDAERVVIKPLMPRATGCEAQCAGLGPSKPSAVARLSPVNWPLTLSRFARASRLERDSDDDGPNSGT